jgi:hypothetical protein
MRREHSDTLPWGRTSTCLNQPAAGCAWVGLAINMQGYSTQLKSGSLTVRRSVLSMCVCNASVRYRTVLCNWCSGHPPQLKEQLTTFDRPLNETRLFLYIESHHIQEAPVLPDDMMYDMVCYDMVWYDIYDMVEYGIMIYDTIYDMV